MKRPFHDDTGPIKNRWPKALQAQVDKAAKVIKEDMDKVVRARLQPSFEDWLQHKIDVTVLERRRLEALTEARDAHPVYFELDEVCERYEEVLEDLEKIEKAVSKCARRIAGETVEESDVDSEGELLKQRIDNLRGERAPAR